MTEQVDHAPEPEVLEGPTAGEEPERSGYPTLVPLFGALVGLAAAAVLLIAALVLPAAKSGPHSLPIGVSGTPQVTSQLRQLFQADGSRAFAISTYRSETALRKAILDRKIYGGLSVSDSSATMFTASAGSTTVADALNSVAASLGSQSGAQIPVTEIVAMPSKDPRGAGLSAAGLPLAFATVLPALLLGFMYRRRLGAQLGAAVGASIAVGLASSAALNYLIGSTHGSNFWLVSGALALGTLAVSVVLLGLNAVAGRTALGIGAALVVLLAAPLSGLATAPEWLPTPWGAIGQFLPPGADATLLRSVAYFDGRSSARSLLVLGAWMLVGLALLGIGFLLARRRGPAAPAAPADQPDGEADGEPVAVNLDDTSSLADDESRLDLNAAAFGDSSR